MSDYIYGSGGGGKKGKKSGRTPKISDDTIASKSTLKALYALSEGEIEGLANEAHPANSIMLDGVPLVDEQGNDNFEGIGYEFVSGTNDQEHISGFPSVSKEVVVNRQLTVAAVTHYSFEENLSAIRVRLRWAALSSTDINTGDVNGYKIDYKIEYRADTGAYKTAVQTSINDKTSAGYERSHRIDLPEYRTSVSIRVTRLTPPSGSDLIQDTMFVDAFTEIVDAKLRYPNTAMLALTIPAEQFSSVPKVSVRLKGVRVKVPSNYNPITRTYSGIWNGQFIEAYTDNPAWIYHELCTNRRYGLGRRLDPTMIDKWSLYQLAQYCDELVNDGKGGKEPRFTCNVYLQARADAYTVLQSISSVFRSMSFWQGEQITLSADMPKDPVYTFTNANVEGGIFNYTGTRARDRHTVAKVAWDNPENEFKTEYEFIRNEAAIAKHGVKVLDIPAFGCTSQGQAQRVGEFALTSEQLETRLVSFNVGLEGFIPQVGDIINVADNLLVDRKIGGRILGIFGQIVRLDREIEGAKGIYLNSGEGELQYHKATNAAGDLVVLEDAVSASAVGAVWAADYEDIEPMKFRVMSITQTSEAMFSIEAIQHEPRKYTAADLGANIKPNIIPPPLNLRVESPSSINLSSRERVEQKRHISTLIISWAQVKGATKYEVQYRKDNGSWINLPVTTNTSVEVDDITKGQYQAKIVAINAVNSRSIPLLSEIVEVGGKDKQPAMTVNGMATNRFGGIFVTWDFGDNSQDISHTEVSYYGRNDFKYKHHNVSFPETEFLISEAKVGVTYTIMLTVWDKLGNKSIARYLDDITHEVDANEVLNAINGAIDESHLEQQLQSKIGQIERLPSIEDRLQQAQNSWSQSVQDIYDEMTNITAPAAGFKAIFRYPAAGEGSANSYLFKEGGGIAETFVEGDGARYHRTMSDVTYYLNPPNTDAGSFNVIRFELTAFSQEKGVYPTWEGYLATITAEGGLTGITLSKNDVEMPPVDKLAHEGDLAYNTTAGDVYISDKFYVTYEFDSSIVPMSEGVLAALVFGGSYGIAFVGGAIKFTEYSGYIVNSVQLGVVSEGGDESLVIAERRDRIAADEALQAEILRIENKQGDISSEIFDFKQVYESDKLTSAQMYHHLLSEYGEAAALIQSESTTRAQEDAALSSQIDSLSAEVGGNAASIEEVIITLSSIDSSAAADIKEIQAVADEAKVIASGKGEIIYSYIEPPASKQSPNNLWFKLGARSGDTTQTPHSWNGTKWIELNSDAAILAGRRADEAMQEAGLAKDEADKKGEVIYQSYAPIASKRKTQNLWIDTAGGANIPKRWNGSSWVEISDRSVLEKIPAQNIASYVEQSGAFASEFDALSGKITTNQRMINGQLESIQVINSLGDADKLQNEINKAELQENLLGLMAKESELDGVLSDIKTQIIELNVKFIAAETNDEKKIYADLANTLAIKQSEVQKEKDELAERVQELFSRLQRMHSLVTTESNVKAQYFIKMDAGGRASGFGLLQDKKDRVDFAVVADKFWISPVGGSSKGERPFIVKSTGEVVNGVHSPAGTYINDAFIRNGSIDSAKIGNAQIGTAKISNLSVNTIKIADGAVTITKVAEGNNEWSGITRYYTDMEYRNVPNYDSDSHLSRQYAHYKPYVIVNGAKRAPRAKISYSTELVRLHDTQFTLYMENAWITATSTTFTNNHNAKVPFDISVYFDNITSASINRTAFTGKARPFDVRILVNGSVVRQVTVHNQVDPVYKLVLLNYYWELGGVYNYYLPASIVELGMGTHTAEVQISPREHIDRNKQGYDEVFQWEGATIWVQGVKK